MRFSPAAPDHAHPQRPATGLRGLPQGGGRCRLRARPAGLPNVRLDGFQPPEPVALYLAAGDVVYGLTTGFGKLKSTAIAASDLTALQRNLVLSHSVGVGPPMPEVEVRIAQILRLNSLLRGVSGVRVELVAQGDALPAATVGAAIFGDRAEHDWAGDARARDILQGLFGGVAAPELTDGLATPTGALSGGESRRASSSSC